MPLVPREIQPWDGEAVDAIVCITTRQCLVPNPGSSLEHCDQCHAEVWLAATSLLVIGRYPNTPLLCLSCAKKRGATKYAHLLNEEDPTVA